MNGYSKKRRLFVAIVAELKVFFAKVEDRVFKNEGVFIFIYRIKVWKKNKYFCSLKKLDNRNQEKIQKLYQ